MYLEDKEPPPSLAEKGNLPDDMEPCQMGFLEGALLEVQGRLSGAILGFSGFVWRAATACLVPAEQAAPGLQQSAGSTARSHCLVRSRNRPFRQLCRRRGVVSLANDTVPQFNRAPNRTVAEHSHGALDGTITWATRPDAPNTIVRSFDSGRNMRRWSGNSP